MRPKPLLRWGARLLRRVEGLAARLERAANGNSVRAYLKGGRLPWSPGYSKYKNQLIRSTLADPELMSRFAGARALPDGFGARLDERVVECPWVVARLRPGKGRILDAGSVLNTPLFLELPQLRERTILIYSLELDWVQLNPRVSYLHADFREPLLRDGLFETIVCISTLEHVGMWPTPKPPYEESLARPQPPKDRLAYREVLQVFRRLLVPGGQLLLTVPFGKAEDHGWLQQFDAAGIRDIAGSFGGALLAESYYRYRAAGWQTATREECADCAFFNVVRTPSFEPDHAAAARAVACLELTRS